MANFTGLAAGRQQRADRAGWDLDRLGLTGGPRVTVLVGAERHDTRRPRRCATSASARRRRSPPTSQGRIAPRRAGRRAARPRAARSIVVPAGRQPALRRVRPVRRGIELAHDARRLGARRRRLRAVGRRRRRRCGTWSPATRRPTRGPPTRTRRSTCRTTAASRSCATRRRCGRAIGRARQLPDPGRRRAGDPLGQGAGALAAGPRRPGVGGAAVAGPPRGRRPGRRAGRARPGDRRGHRRPCRVPRCSTTSSSPRCASAFGDDERTRAVTAALLADGTAWMSGSRWRGRDVLRVSVSNWSTDAADVDASVDAVRRAVAAVDGDE